MGFGLDWIGWEWIIYYIQTNIIIMLIDGYVNKWLC